MKPGHIGELVAHAWLIAAVALFSTGHWIGASVALFLGLAGAHTDESRS